MNSNAVQIQIFDNNSAMSRFAAEMIFETAKSAVYQRGQFHFVLSGGGTPAPVYELLAESEYLHQFPWSQTHVYWGDERCVPPDDPGSNYGQAKHLLLEYVPIPRANVHRVKGELSPMSAAEEYKTQLQQLAEGDLAWPIFDIVLLGLGSDGHTASLFPRLVPEEAFNQPAIAVTAHYGDRPANRVTLTPLVINSARSIIFLVNGASKADAVSKALDGPFQPEMWPVQMIKSSDGQVMWLLDEAAAGNLKRQK